MKRVELSVETSTAASEALSRIRDFETFPLHSDVIRSVRTRQAGVAAESEWEVSFRQGLLTWVERDSVDVDRLTLEFRLVDGDFDVFEGWWAVVSGAQTSRVYFSCAFDFGIPSMAGLLEPVAARVLSTSIRQVLGGLLDDVHDLDPQSRAGGGGSHPGKEAGGEGEGDE
ncbi:MAG: SRPBCC family protein [Micrococcus sp.]|nr:SRPBCC family protein [Micrococcus sp.]